MALQFPILKVPLGGMDDGYMPSWGMAERIEEMTRDRQGFWSAAGWSKDLFYEVPGNPFDAATLESIETITWFGQHNNNRQFLVWEQWDGTTLDLVCFNGSTQQWDTIEADRTYLAAPWAKTQYLGIDNWLFYVNGYDRPSRWDGQRILGIGFDRPPPTPAVQVCTATISAAAAPDEGVGSDDASYTYGYAITWVNDRGSESPTSALQFITGTNAAGARALIAVRVPPGPAEARACRIYRTIDLTLATGPLEQAQLFLLDEQHGPMGYVYIDGTPDGHLGAAFDPTGTGLFPRGAKYIGHFKGTAFYAGMPEYPSRLVYSAPLFDEQFPPDNFFPVGGPASGEIRGMYATKNALVIVKTRGIYLLKGDPASGFQLDTLTEDHGGVAPRGICEVPGQGLLIVSDVGILLLEGALENTGTPTRIIDLTKPDEASGRQGSVARNWKKVNPSALITATATVYHRDQEVWIQVCTGGRSRPDLGFIYHYATGAWSLRQRPVTCMVESRDHRGLLFLGVHDATLKNGAHYTTVGVHVYSPAFSLTVSAVYQTSWLRTDGENTRQVYRKAEIFGLALGRQSAKVEYRQDEAEEFTEYKKLVLTMPEDDTRQQWGFCNWSATERWTDYPTVQLPAVPLETNQALLFQLRISGSRMYIGELNLQVTRNAQDIRPFDRTGA